MYPKIRKILFGSWDWNRLFQKTPYTDAYVIIPGDDVEISTLTIHSLQQYINRFQFKKIVVIVNNNCVLNYISDPRIHFILMSDKKIDNMIVRWALGGIDKKIVIASFKKPDFRSNIDYKNIKIITKKDIVEHGILRL